MKTVFVGLSGGVDSAVSAALLKQEGYRVVGAFIKIWRPEFTECTWKEDRVDAMRVCAALDIPYREVDLSDEYKKEVVDKMVADYARGITPNPDVLCNRAIKFGHFARWAFGQGADLVATGHYARIEKRAGAYHLLRGVDGGKDQSYFLHRLSQEDLSRAVFPIGHLEKREVRTLAKRFDIPVAIKRDSQGLCFIGDITMREFLVKFITLKPGVVLDMKGENVGSHDGAALYTVGQRHGFLVSGSTAPYYVVALDERNNTLRVSMSRDDAARSRVTIENMHWVSGKAARGVFQAQGRYRETPFPVKVEDDGIVSFTDPRIVAPGQSLVLYVDDHCVGGGEIAP